MRKKYKTNYTDEVKKEALEAMKSGRMSEEFCVPKSTLADSIKVGLTILFHDINDQFSFREFTENQSDIRWLFHKRKKKYCVREQS